MFEDIQIGDTVYFSTPHSKELKGKAVMLGPIGWVHFLKVPSSPVG